MMKELRVVLDRIEVLGCQDCARGFLSASDYTLHALTHVKHKVYNRFLQSKNNKEKFTKPFQCEDCDKTFVLKSTLNSHLELHKPMPHVCECGIGFYKVQNLRAHKVLVHNTKTKTRTRGPWKPKINYTGPKLQNEFKVTKVNGFEAEAALKVNCDSGTFESEDERKSRSETDSDVDFLTYKKTISKMKPRLKATLIQKENRKPKYKSRKIKPKQQMIKQKSENENKLEAQMTRTADNKFQCPDCKKIFKEKSYLTIHYRIHTGEKPYTCNICQKKFTQHGNWISHLKRHTGIMEHFCRHCNKGFLLLHSLKLHERTHTGVKPYKCEICGKAFSDPSAYARHMRIHSGDMRYRCEWCSKGFTDFSGFRMHTKRHLNERNESCDICNRRFYSKHDLRNHIKAIHLKTKDYECDECGRFFCVKGNWQRHVEIYHKKYKFECDECSKRFALKKKLLKHIRNKHLHKILCYRCFTVFYSKTDIKRHKLEGCIGRPCKFCTRTFMRVDDLKRHVQKTHSNITFDCDRCGSQLSSRGSIVRHICSLHPKLVSKKVARIYRKK